MVLKYHAGKPSNNVRDILSLMPILSRVRSCADEIVFFGVLVLQNSLKLQSGVQPKCSVCVAFIGTQKFCSWDVLCSCPRDYFGYKLTGSKKDLSINPAISMWIRIAFHTNLFYVFFSSIKDNPRAKLMARKMDHMQTLKLSNRARTIMNSGKVQTLI